MFLDLNLKINYVYEKWVEYVFVESEKWGNKGLGKKFELN